MPDAASSPHARCLGIATLALLALGACRSSRYLDDDERLVRRVEIELAGDRADVAPWRTFRTELAQQVVTRPNGRFLLVAPREYFHLRAEQRADTTRFQRFVLRIIAEEPALLTAEATRQSVDRLTAYMRNRGYFDAEVAADVDTLREHAVAVTYAVSPRGEYRYGEVAFVANDPVIDSLLAATRPASALAPGQRVDARDYDREVARIVSLLRDNGYAEFYANSVAPLEADSAGRRVDATLQILPPAEGGTHRRSRVGRVTVFPDHDPLATSQTLAVDTFVDGVRFIYEDEALVVEPAPIAGHIYFRPGEVYRQSALRQTNLQLNALGVFGFVTIRQEPSPVDSQAVDFYVELSRTERWELGADVELSVTDRQAVSGSRLSLIGGQLSGTLSNRNVAGGAERLSLSANTGVEFNLAQLGADTIQRLNTIEFGGSVTYDLPRFRDYFGLYRGLNRVRSGLDERGDTVHVVPDPFYAALRERATTRYQLSASYVSLLNFYRTTTVSGTFGYLLAPRPTDRLAINHVGLEYFALRAEPAFRDILDETPFLQRSLGDQVFSGLLLRDVTWTRNRPARGGPQRGTWSYAIDVEQSGFEAFAVNKVRNAFSGDTSVFRLGDLDYARYGRLLASVAHTRPAGLRQSFALRALGGVAVTYGFTREERDVPYVRQFFSGGTASMRGWQARGLGPGGYRDPEFLPDFDEATGEFGDPDNTQPRYQHANLRLELNAEYRAFLTNLWTTRLEGALFADAGNIWTLRRDSSRPGSQFRFDALRDEGGAVVNEPFYRQVALNAGVGFRLDISYVLLRLDFGLKLRSPYPVDVDGPDAGPGPSYWPRNFESEGLSRWNFAVGLDYPF